MKIALVCIAKNEDNYIQEWCDYHLKLGFDDIFIYQNNWRTDINGDNIHKFEIDGVAKQRDAYNKFINDYHNEYEWGAFFDIDEFLVLKKHNNVKDFINEYNDFPSVGINWVLFGDNNIKTIDGDYSLIRRFTKRQNQVNNHIKSIVKLQQGLFMDVHNPHSIWVDTHKNHNSGPFTQVHNDDIAQLNHYFCKTEIEFIEKCDRGRADTPQYRRSMKDFHDHNFNEIEDLTAFNFYFNDNHNLLNA
jgi:hypothetical protein